MIEFLKIQKPDLFNIADLFNIYLIKITYVAPRYFL
jgi:hypothetical protein